VVNKLRRFLHLLKTIVGNWYSTVPIIPIYYRPYNPQAKKWKLPIYIPGTRARYKRLKH
jgi:hypothetical protein